MHMIARKSFEYAGVRLHQGDRFQARGQSDARVLAAVKLADPCDPPYGTEPAPPPVPVAEPPAPRRKRAYARRDMIAADDVDAAVERARPDKPDGPHWPFPTGTGAE